MKIYISGASGFLGKHVAELFSHDFDDVNTQKVNLLDPIETDLFISLYKPDMVIHLAGKVAGIEENINKPAEFIYDNMVMGLNLVSSCAENGVKRFVNIASSCCYPDFGTDETLTTDKLWKGEPNWTHAPYGLSKRMMIKVCDAFQRQYGIECVSIILANLYGPGDKWHESGSHVIPSLFRRITEAKEKGLSTLTIFGDPQSTREFLYVKDAAKAIHHFAKTYHNTEPLNYGTTETTTLGDLANQISSIVGFKGNISYNHSKPNGNRFRRMDSTKAHKHLKPQTNLPKGLQEAFNDFQSSITHELPL